ncbi:MAG: RNA polymerase sigma factor [Emcibacter sp.]|nr:RNA polymerase sigma factor [Emcibacter sp.]
MTRIAEGDRTAYKMLVDRHLRSYLAFATRVIGDRMEAEDIMQEAFIRVWKNASKWDQDRKTRFTTWFYRIVMNLCIDVKRRRKRKPVSELEEAYDISSDDPLPDARLSDKQMAVKISEALEELPERQKMVMTLCYLQGLGNKEAAEILNISTGAIESLLVRGRKKMAELLKAEKQEFLKEII